VRQESRTAGREWARGIDVSERHGTVDWSRVVGAHIDFAYALATRGGSQRDGRFTANWDGLKGAALLRGAIHLFHPAANIEAQVDSFLAALGRPEAGDLPPALQLAPVPTETGLEQWRRVKPDERAARVLKWLEAVARTVGKPPVVFCGHGFLATHMTETAALSRYDLWIEEDTKAPMPTLPSGWNEWKLWRHVEHGSAAGVSHPVSLDRFNGTLSELREFVRRKTAVSGRAEEPVEPAEDEGGDAQQPEAGGEQPSSERRPRRHRSTGEQT